MHRLLGKQFKGGRNVALFAALKFVNQWDTLIGQGAPSLYDRSEEAYSRPTRGSCSQNTALTSAQPSQRRIPSRPGDIDARGGCTEARSDLPIRSTMMQHRSATIVATFERNTIARLLKNEHNISLNPIRTSSESLRLFDDQSIRPSACYRCLQHFLNINPASKHF